MTAQLHFQCFNKALHEFLPPLMLAERKAPLSAKVVLIAVESWLTPGHA